MSNKVAFFLPSLSGGGAEKAFVLIANWLAESGQPVDVLLMNRDGPYLNDLHGSVRVVAPPTAHGMRSGARSFAMLLSYIRRERPAALVSSLNAPNLMSPVARQVLRLGGALAAHGPRLVVSQQVALSVDTANSPSPRAKYFPPLAKRTFALADLVVAASRGVKEDLVKTLGLQPCNVGVIYNPVDLARLEVLSSQHLDDPWFAPNSPPVIVGAGRLHPQKDFATLIRSVANLKRAGVRVRLLIFGEGPERRRLEQLAATMELSESVRLPGFVSNPFAYVRRSAAFVLSSRWEGFGNVVLEALAVGTPVVSTDCPSGPSEILNGGQFGRLVPAGDPDRLADAIAATMAAPPDAAALRARAREFEIQRIGAEWARALRVPS